MSPGRFLAGVVAIAAVTAVGLAGCASSDQVGSDQAALVNGTAISLDRLERASKALEASQAGSGQSVDAGAASRQALQSLIQQQIVIDGAKNEGIEVSDADVDGQIKQYEQQAASNNQKLDDVLQQQGITRDDLRERARVDLAVQRLGDKLVPGKSDAELANEVKARRGEFLQVQARHVLVKDEATAKKVRGDLERDGDWATVAKQSQDPGSKDKGGELGYISKGQTVPEFDKTLYELAEQGNCKGANGACQSPISQPVKSQFGWHVLQVTGVRLPEAGQLRQQLEGQDLVQKRQTALQDWYKELLGSAKVSINPRFGQWNSTDGTVVDRDTAPKPAPTPGATPNPAQQQAPESTQANR
jgi:foldase protein PrsA